MGRPVSNTDDCAPPSDSPQAASVWLDSTNGPGVIEFDNGYVRTTVFVNGSRLSVTTDDPR